MDTARLEKHLKAGELETVADLVSNADAARINEVNTALLLAVAWRQLCRPEKAVRFSERAANLDPHAPHLHLLYSSDLLKAGELSAAETVLDRVGNDPRLVPEITFRRSKLRYQEKDFDGAGRMLFDLVSRVPGFAGAHLELAHSLLMRGNWRAGWQEYEWRFRLPETKHLLPKFRMPHWDGGATDHLLLVADQGYGDCFQFARYLPLVAERCQRVSLIRSQPLSRLMDASPAVSLGYSQWENTPRTSAWSTLSGLPRLFHTEPNSIPDCEGVLRAEEELVSLWKERLGKRGSNAKLRVGLAWTGRVDFELNPMRAMPFERLAPLLRTPGVKFYSLQVGPAAFMARDSAATDLSPQLTDFAQTAAAMEALDLVITTDTATAHLAGTLGRPTWVLLNHAPDWRWGADGETSAWYPSARLFRQDERRDWAPVVEACRAALAEVVDACNPGDALRAPGGRA